MDMPRPGEAHARLHKLIGRWSGDETLHPAPWDPAGGPATGAVENRLVLDGFAVVQEYQQQRGGVPNFSGHGLFWWDAPAGQYVMTWFDSMMGRPAEYRGDFEGEVLRLVNAMPQGGFARCSFDCGDADGYVFTMEVSADGRIWAPAMEGRYRRHPSPAPRDAGRAIGGKAKTAKAAPGSGPATAKRRSAASARAGGTKPRRVVGGRRVAARGARGKRRR